MEELKSHCCNAPKKIVDNWIIDPNKEMVRFTYVCSECGEDFLIKQNETT